MANIWDSSMHSECRSISAKMVSLMPCEEEKEGLKKMNQYVISLLEERRFRVETITNSNADYRPVITAILDCGKDTTIGFFGHYDVEVADAERWSSNPWGLTDVEGRWQARGVADNIVPLVQRILLAPELSKHANLVFVLQGEEEIGSPFAMEVYPNLRLPNIDLWFEETGYFYKNGDHRIMALNVNDKLESVMDELRKLNLNFGIDTKTRIRPMNKAFGNQGCPCLVHLLNNVPYIALGPNDDFSKIHGVDESINPALLERAACQIIKAVEVYSS